MLATLLDYVFLDNLDSKMGSDSVLVHCFLLPPLYVGVFIGESLQDYSWTESQPQNAELGGS